MMHTDIHKIKSRRPFVLAGMLLLICVFVLAACGNNTTTGSPPSNGAATPTRTPTTTPGQASANGCPSRAVVTTAPAPAGVTLTSKNSNSTVSVNKGETIEIDLPFGHLWSGPSDLSQGLLTMQSPAGYESPSAKVCVWRFVATGTGTAHFSFVGRPICKKGQLCPMYVMAVPFTIEIK